MSLCLGLSLSMSWYVSNLNIIVLRDTVTAGYSHSNYNGDLYIDQLVLTQRFLTISLSISDFARLCCEIREGSSAIKKKVKICWKPYSQKSNLYTIVPVI